MELSALSQNIVMVPLKRGAETLELQVNIDAFTPQFFREMRKRAEQQYQQLNAELRQPVKATSRRKSNKPLTKRQVEEQLRLQNKQQLDVIELQARRLETERETNIEFLLPHILKGWDVVEDGEPVALTKEVLNTLPPKLIQEIFDVCVKAAKTVKKKADQDEVEETSENTTAGSRVLHAVGQTM